MKVLGTDMNYICLVLVSKVILVVTLMQRSFGADREQEGLV